MSNPVINNSGTKQWYKECLLHRDNGSAIEYSNGTKAWYKEGLLHRDDGPAVEYSNGDKEWHYNGEKIRCQSTEEFIRLIKLKVFW